MFRHIGLLDSSSVLGDVRFEWLYIKFFDLCSSDGCLGSSFGIFFNHKNLHLDSMPVSTDLLDFTMV
jgi:hypothetical protein